MSCNDWANAILALAMLVVPFTIALYRSPRAKRLLAIRLLASADADEYRTQYYVDRLRELRRECKELPVRRG